MKSAKIPTTKSTLLLIFMVMAPGKPNDSHPKYLFLKTFLTSLSFLIGVTKIWPLIAKLQFPYGTFCLIFRSSAKKYDSKKPLGSTIVPIFDDKGKLRQGKFHLFIWPDVLPDLD
jgi:hypothetical protein